MLSTTARLPEGARPSLKGWVPEVGAGADQRTERAAGSVMLRICSCPLRSRTRAHFMPRLARMLPLPLAPDSCSTLLALLAPSIDCMLSMTAMPTLLPPLPRGLNARFCPWPGLIKGMSL